MRLGVRFWDHEPWRTIWVKHCVQANRLLKRVDVKVILRALKSPNSLGIYSLANARLRPLLKAAESALSRECDAAPSYSPDYDATEQPRHAFKKNVRDKLEEL